MLRLAVEVEAEGERRREEGRSCLAALLARAMAGVVKYSRSPDARLRDEPDEPSERTLHTTNNYSIRHSCLRKSLYTSVSSTFNFSGSRSAS